MPLTKSTSRGSLRVIPSVENLSKLFSGNSVGGDGSDSEVMSSSAYWEEGHDKSKGDKVWDWKDTVIEYHIPDAIEGQVEATNEAVVEGFPTEAELASKVHKLSSKLRGQLLAPDGFVPTKFTGQLVKLFLEHNQGNAGRRGNFHIEDSQGHELSGKLHMEEHKRFMSKHAAFVLYDKNSRASVLVMRKRSKDFDTFGIYSSVPLNTGDAHKIVESGVEFYPWLQVKENDNTHLDPRSVGAWDGQEFVPMWTASPGPHVSSVESLRESGEILVTDNETGDCVGYLLKENHDGHLGWAITAAPGVDPAIMLCLAAVMEDSLSHYDDKEEEFNPMMI